MVAWVVGNWLGRSIGELSAVMRSSVLKGVLGNKGMPACQNPSNNTVKICAFYYMWILSQKEKEGFPGGAVVENLPASAGDTGLSPGLGRSHMPQSNWAREPQLLSLRVWSLCSATREAVIVKRPSHRDEEWPPLAATRESPRTETKTQHSQK